MQDSAACWELYLVSRQMLKAKRRLKRTEHTNRTRAVRHNKLLTNRATQQTPLLILHDPQAERRPL